jgi:hypothetical protein
MNSAIAFDFSLRAFLKNTAHATTLALRFQWIHWFAALLTGHMAARRSNDSWPHLHVTLQAPVWASSSTIVVRPSRESQMSMRAIGSSELGGQQFDYER